VWLGLCRIRDRQDRASAGPFVDRLRPRGFAAAHPGIRILAANHIGAVSLRDTGLKAAIYAGHA